VTKFIFNTFQKITKKINHFISFLLLKSQKITNIHVYYYIYDQSRQKYLKYGEKVKIYDECKSITILVYFICRLKEDITLSL